MDGSEAQIHEGDIDVRMDGSEAQIHYLAYPNPTFDSIDKATTVMNNQHGIYLRLTGDRRSSVFQCVL